MKLYNSQMFRTNILKGFIKIFFFLYCKKFPMTLEVVNKFTTTKQYRKVPNVQSRQKYPRFKNLEKKISINPNKNCIKKQNKNIYVV